MRVEYDSNNSGGGWWLKDEDWKALEAAGWDVEWEKGRKDIRVLKADADGRWLGALATKASKNFETPGEAMREFEKVTGQTVSDAGCSCCGPPHSFDWAVGEGREYASGEGCLPYLFPDRNVPANLRDALDAGGSFK